MLVHAVQCWNCSRHLAPVKIYKPPLFLTREVGPNVKPISVIIPIGWSGSGTLNLMFQRDSLGHWLIGLSREQSRYAPSQWEMALQCDNVSHWLSTFLDWSLPVHLYQGSMSPTHFSSQFQFDGKFDSLLFYSCSWYHHKCLHMPWQLCCHAMCKIL